MFVVHDLINIYLTNMIALSSCCLFQVSEWKSLQRTCGSPGAFLCCDLRVTRGSAASVHVDKLSLVMCDPTCLSDARELMETPGHV